MVNINTSKFSEAHRLFDGLGVKIVSGHRFLGGFIGPREEQIAFVKSLVTKWISLIDHLTQVAKEQPQAAYSALTRSIQNKWQFIQRLVFDCESCFDLLELRIATSFLPTIFGCEISSDERNVFSLPTRLGGLNILNPTKTGQFSYTLSRGSTEVLVQSLKGLTDFTFDLHFETISTVHKEMFKDKDLVLEDSLTSTLQQLDLQQQRAILRAKGSKISLWLNVLPVSRHQFDLSAQEFRDALAIRYRKPLLGIPLHCDGCGSDFDLSHALSCRKGGLVIQRHNEIRDTFGDLSALVWGQVCREPVVRESRSDSPALPCHQRSVDATDRGVV